MTESVVFQGSKRRYAQMTIVCLIGALMVYWDKDNPTFRPWAVGVALAFAALFVARLIRRSPVYLRLDEEGLEIHCSARDNLRIKWTEIHEVLLDKVNDSTVLIVYSTPQGERSTHALRSEYRASLPEIFSMLKAWRARYRSAR